MGQITTRAPASAHRADSAPAAPASMPAAMPAAADGVPATPHPLWPALPGPWANALGPALSTPAMADLAQFLLAQGAAGKNILPPRADWFRALHATLPG
ncbi:MAG: hypothetical protein ACKOUM_03170, partial [Sphingopyxis sp.]